MSYSVFHDLRLAIRQLGRSKSFTITVILTLALGIGLNAAIFTMVDCVLLRPLGYHDADRIYGLNTRFTNLGRDIPRLAGADYMDVAGKVSSLEHVAYYQTYQDNLEVTGHTLFADIGHVSPEFGLVMGVEPLAGRLFSTDSKPVVDPNEALVSSAFALEYFGSATQALGQVVKYDGKPRVIVGVLPSGFSFPGKSQVWIELPTTPDVLNRTSYNQRVIGKVKPGVTEATLRAEMATLSSQLSAAYPEDKLKTEEAVSLQEQLVGKIRPVLRLLMASVVVVLLIVCANITHLQLVRATRLLREVTIRTALGASRMTLARRAGLEVCLLATGGCVAGILVAVPALRLLVRLAPPDIPRLTDVHLNTDVIAVSFLVSLVAMAMAALLPLWRSWQVDPAAAMKQDAGRGLESRGAGRLRQALIVGEVALTLMLTVAATLLVRQLVAESRQDLGFAPDHLLMLSTHKTRAAAGLAKDQQLDPILKRASSERDVAVLDSLMGSVRGVPGVAMVGAASSAPMSGSGSDVGYAVRGVSDFKDPNAILPDANIMAVTPDYLRTMGIPVLKGRWIAESDRAGSELVVVISESLARQSFAGQDPIGKQIMCGWDDVDVWETIVGVVGDVRQDSPASVPAPTFYAPVTQHPAAANDMQVIVRTRSDADAMTITLGRLMSQRFPQVAVKSMTMHEAVGESERAQHFRTLLFGSFAGVSILLAMTGMYGVTAYTVAQRRFEFALRFALGAQRGQVLRSVLRGALMVAGVGVLAGVAMSLAMTRVIATLLGQMPHFDPVTYGVAVGGVLLIALTATVLPAQRAATVDPMQVLRSE